MCGIAGILGPGSRSPGLLAAMAGALSHRGPDDEGLWQDPDAPIGFAHRRLSIVDLTAAGHQPMASADGRWVLSFNGQFYNHRELRAALDRELAHEWRGHNDGETFLEAVARWGLDRAIETAVGMFAIALWDRRERRLHLVRDRFGEKPLYYGRVGGDFIFASELKAIRRHPGFDLAVDRRAVADLLARGVIGAPLSIYRGIMKLGPGERLEVDVGAAALAFDRPPPLGARDGPVRRIRYWSYRDVVAAGLATPFAAEGEAIDALDGALREAVGGQAMADVPVGAFLSGGIDSSLVTAVYQALQPGGVRTFTIGFGEPAYDESAHAAEVARRLGTEHHIERVSASDAMAVIPMLPAMYDEPFADTSQIPTYLVSRLARRDVKVALSGDGGDELFGGYNRYLMVPRLWRALQRMPRPLRRPAAGLLAALPPALWDRAGAWLPGASRQAHVGTKVHKLAGLMRGARTLDDVVAAFLDEWQAGTPPLAFEAENFDREEQLLGPDAPDAARLMLADASRYLPDDILCKVDRASMAVGLETRAPFLDHRLAAVAARIPLSMKIRGGTGKLTLRRLLDRYLPGDLFDRPKAGFAIPVGEWLRGPLRGWAEQLLDPARLRVGGLVDEARVTARWRSHLSGAADSTQAVWSVLMLEAWLESVS